jgi:signal transduction histidine kinase
MRYYSASISNFLAQEEAVNSRSPKTRVASRTGMEPSLDDSRNPSVLEAAVFAHEFANELSTLHSAVKVMEIELARNAAATQQGSNIGLAVEHVKSGIARLDRLLGEFRSHTRARRVNRRKADLARIIQDLLIDERKSYAARGIRVETKLAQGLPRLPLDGAKIRQALLNLCRNAADAMPAGGTLKLRAYRTGRNLHLAVADTGEGIPPEIDVFELFRTTKPDGTGIGLAIVREIISAHRGKITYASVRGKGTIFRVLLPLK